MNKLYNDETSQKCCNMEKKNEMKIPKGFISSVLGGASCIPVKHIAQHL
jgi:hypothetical protein